MPAFIEQQWLDYKIISLPEDKPRNRTRRISRHFIPPYFNGSFIYFDLIFQSPEKDIKETIKYEWELLDKDGNSLKKGGIQYKY